MRALLACVFLIAATLAAQAERRAALVFGADAYRTLRPLGNAVNDAQAVERTLSGLGFEVSLETNRDLRRMRRALEDFREEAAGADVALVFFAGHGVEIKGENRLLPVDAKASTLANLKASTLPLEEIRETVASVAKVGLVLLDACRNDPFSGVGAEGRGAVEVDPEVAAAVRPGLGRVGRAENILFAFSAAPGETAADGAGGNSPFTAALTKYLGTDGLEIRSVLTLVQQEVYDVSRGGQLPYVESGLPALFFAATTPERLPERERLLLAMAEVTPDLRDEVEKLAAANDMPLAPLFGALIGARLERLTDDDRNKKLAEAAQAYAETSRTLRTLASSDPEVSRLRSQAEQQLSLGAFAQARERLAIAARIDAAAGEALAANLVERRISEARTHVADAGVARTQLDYRAAIAALELAAALHGRFEREDIADAVRGERNWLLAEIGDLHVLTGNTVAALEAFGRMRQAAEARLARAPASPDAERDLAVSYERIGIVRVMQGDLASALKAYQATLEIVARLAASDPGHTGWQRDLAVGHNKIGDMRVAQGDLAGALKAYQDGLGIAARLTASDPGNATWQRDLSVSFNRIGDVRVGQGDLAGALKAYQDGLTTATRLTASDPKNSIWQHDLAFSHNRMGDVRMAKGDLAGALKAYRESLGITERLAASDPGQSGWQRELSVAHNKIGDVRLAQGGLADALKAYENGLDIVTGMAAGDPRNALWQRDLSFSHNRIGDVRMAQGDLAGALKAYQSSLAVMERLVASDSGNAAWQRELSVGHNKIGDVRKAQGDLAGALEAYQDGLGTIKRLAARDPGNVIWQRDLSISHDKMGDVRKTQGDLAGALKAYQDSFGIRLRLAARDPGNAEWQRDLIVSHIKMATAGGNARDHLAAALEVALSMEARGILAPADAGIPQLLRDELKKLDAP